MRDGVQGGVHRVHIVHTCRAVLSSARLLERVLEPTLVLVVDEAVGEDALALVLPKGHELLFGVDDLGGGRAEDALEDAREVAQVEDVVELGGRGQHARLG